MRKIVIIMMLTLLVGVMSALITVNAPNGVTVIKGHEIEISWSSSVNDRISLIFADQNGNDRGKQFAENLPSNGTYRYKIADHFPRGYYRVKAYRANQGYRIESGISSGSFLLETPSIKITNPSVGEYWVCGTDQTIKWNSDSYTGTVWIQGKFPGGTMINWAAPNTGSYRWKVPEISGGSPEECFIEIFYNDLTGQSDSTRSRDKSNLFFIGRQKTQSQSQQNTASATPSFPVASGFSRCAFTTNMIGEWYCNGTCNYSIRNNNGLSIRTGNKFYSVLDTYTDGKFYQVFSKQVENGQFYTFFFTLDSSNKMRANLSNGHVNRVYGDFADHNKK